MLSALWVYHFVHVLVHTNPHQERIPSPLSRQYMSSNTQQLQNRGQQLAMIWINEIQITALLPSLDQHELNRSQGKAQLTN